MDYNDCVLCMVIVGCNELGKNINGYECEDGFDIFVVFELMVILVFVLDLCDLCCCIGNVVLVYDLDGNLVIIEDLKVVGVMVVSMKEVIELILM